MHRFLCSEIWADARLNFFKIETSLRGGAKGFSLPMSSFQRKDAPIVLRVIRILSVN